MSKLVRTDRTEVQVECTARVIEYKDTTQNTLVDFHTGGGCMRIWIPPVKAVALGFLEEEVTTIEPGDLYHSSADNVVAVHSILKHLGARNIAYTYITEGEDEGEIFVRRESRFLEYYKVGKS